MSEPQAEPQVAPICAYDLEVIGEGSWVLGYMRQPAQGEDPVEHMAFAMRRDTQEMFTLQRRPNGGEDPYLRQPHNLSAKMPEQVLEKMELIADTAHALGNGRHAGVDSQMIAFQGSSKAWSVGLAEDGKSAYAASLDGDRLTLTRPVADDGFYLHEPEHEFDREAVPERAYDMMCVVASTAGYMQLADRIAAKTQGFASREDARRTQPEAPETGQTR